MKKKVLVLAAFKRGKRIKWPRNCKLCGGKGYLEREGHKCISIWVCRCGNGIEFRPVSDK